MIMLGTCSNFVRAIEWVGETLRVGHRVVQPDQWQSMDVSGNPLAKMAEILDVSFQVSLTTSDIRDWQEDIKPNLPWADDHFLERVGGLPLNPGVQWKSWPWASSADAFRTEERFSHTYMERYWPKEAGYPDNASEINQGIRYQYGDLEDVVNHLAKHPLSRQAFLPVWFPEDTGVVHGERVPCTLGYHFILRNEALHCTYYIRSCDFYRHFRDDLYLTVRLQDWVLKRLRTHDPRWNSTKLGNFTFHCVSMHCFRADFQKLFKQDI